MSETKATLPACPVETTLTLIGDKWKVLILRDLMPGTKRFGELKKSVGSVSQKVLTAQLRAIRLITENDWTVARTERYVDEQLSAAKGKARLSRFVLRDMRLFLNGINHQLDLIRAAGLNPQTEQEETERELVLTIRIPKSVSGR